MSNKFSLDIDLNQEYVLGLIDFLSRPTLEPYPMQGGYGLNPKVNIQLRQSEIIFGVISKFLENKRIKHQYKSRNSEGVPKHILISKSEDIQKLRDLGQKTFIQAAERLEYLVAVNREYGGKTIVGNEELFYQLYKPWADMHPYWDSKKYTLDFFEDEFDISAVGDLFDAPDPKYPESISTDYVAGAFDANGMISLAITEQPVNNTGYAMNPTARISVTHPDIRVKPNFIRYLERQELEPSISKRDGRLDIRFVSTNNLEKFIEKIGGSTTYLYDLCELFYSQLIPAYKDQYHTSKEGFLDMLRAFEEVAPERPRAQYTTEFFEKEWEMEG